MRENRMLEVGFGLSTPGLEDNQKCGSRERAYMPIIRCFPDKIWMKNRDSKPRRERSPKHTKHVLCSVCRFVIKKKTDRRCIACDRKYGEGLASVISSSIERTTNTSNYSYPYGCMCFFTLFRFMFRLRYLN